MLELPAGIKAMYEVDIFEVEREIREIYWRNEPA
jgi:hypothetical protein